MNRIDAARAIDEMVKRGTDACVEQFAECSGAETVKALKTLSAIEGHKLVLLIIADRLEMAAEAARRAADALGDVAAAERRKTARAAARRGF
ncbi:MAG: hypothetical protein HUK22_06030 [Thermoguttaceae bacterium]|nr:hypothetical protein [Thermoguttaceae bacterium]